MTHSVRTGRQHPGSLLIWQILAPTAALFFVLVLLSGILARQFFAPLAMQRDLERAQRDADLAAAVFAKSSPTTFAQQIPEELPQTHQQGTLAFFPSVPQLPWRSPRFLPAHHRVEAWAPVVNGAGLTIGVVNAADTADAVAFADKTIRAFAIASCVSFALVFALFWLLLKRRVTDRLGAIVQEIDAHPDSANTEVDAIEQTRRAITQSLANAHAREQQLRRFLEKHNELACIATPEGRLVDANESYCRFFGKKREEIIGTSCLDLIQPAFRMEVVRTLQSLSAERPEAELEHPITHADGSTRWVKWHAKAVSNPGGKTREIMSFWTDITPQKQAEESLAKLHRAFDQMQSLAETGSITWDFADDQMEWTSETRRLLGMDATTSASLESFLAAVAPGDRDNLWRLFSAAREEGREFECEFRATLTDGSMRVLQSRAEVLADPKTKLLNRLTCTLRDITALRDAEAATKRELRFREAVEQSLGVGIVVSDEKGRNLLLNRAFCEMTGWSKDELVGITAPYPYWPEEEMPVINKAFDLAITGSTPPAGFELKFCRKDGSRFDVLVKVAPLLDAENNHQLGWLGAVTDISSIQQTRRELTKAETALREQLAFREAVEKSTTVGLIAIGANGHPLSANETFCKMLGYTQQEILSFYPPYPYWPENSREEIERAFAMHLAGKTPSGGFQLRFRKKDGSPIDVLITAAPLIDADGKQIATLSALTDITPLQETKRRLQLANERLQTAQDIAAFGIWEWDPAKGILQWDKQSFAIFGYPGAEDAGSVWRNVHSEEEQERLTDKLDRLIATGGTSGQDRFRVRWLDGSVHNILSTYVILRDAKGKTTRVLGVNRDVTTELEEENELRNAQERLAAALEGGNLGTFEHVVGVGDFNYNPANYDINGIDPSIKDPVQLFAAWKEITGEFFPQLMEEMSSLPGTQTNHTYEFTARPRGKEPRRVRVSIFIERDKHGQPVKLVGVTRRID